MTSLKETDPTIFLIKYISNRILSPSFKLKSWTNLVNSNARLGQDEVKAVRRTFSKSRLSQVMKKSLNWCAEIGIHFYRHNHHHLTHLLSFNGYYPKLVSFVEDL